MSLRLTPGQLREVAELRSETYRHWKKALPPLRRENRHGPSYSAGDLLAVGIVKSLVHGLGLKVGAITEISGRLFTLCNDAPWHAVAGADLMIDLVHCEVGFEPGPAGERDQPWIVVPCGPIIAALRNRLALDGDQQTSLPFPLTSMGGRAQPEATVAPAKDSA